MWTKWLWSVLDCVTRLVSLDYTPASPSCNPVTPVECVLMSFRTHSGVLAYITQKPFKQNKNYSCLLIMIYFLLLGFRLHESKALNDLREICHLQRCDMVTVCRLVLLLCCYDFESAQRHYDIKRFEYVTWILWRYTMYECVVHIHYQNWIAQCLFTNMTRTS